jgi:hypothetical protein
MKAAPDAPAAAASGVRVNQHYSCIGGGCCKGAMLLAVVAAILGRAI